MANFEFDDSAFDDLMDNLSRIEIPCPECSQPFEISLDDISEIVTCPHCNAEIKIESE